MRYRKIDVRVWGDQKFRSLTPLLPSGQALFLYLLTNPNTNSIPGLYRAGPAAMAEELGWHFKDFQKALEEVINEDLIQADLDARVIFIPNAITYNKPESPNVVTGWKTYWDELPECELKTLAYQHFKDLLEGYGEAYAKAFAKAIPKLMPNQEQEQEQEQEIINICQVACATRPQAQENSSTKANNEVTELFNYWREVTKHPKAKLDKARRQKIVSALKNYSVEDLKKAICGCSMSEFHMGKNDKGQSYNDISLIFRNAEKIEKFMALEQKEEELSAPAALEGVIL